MASKAYSQKYRQLKQVFEQVYQKPVSDIFWYRLISQLKRYLNFSIDNPNAEIIIKQIALIKKSYRNFRINSAIFSECWKLFQYYYRQNTEISCADFLADLAKKIDISQVSRTTRYDWFSKAKTPYKAAKKYSSKNLALVAFYAAKSIKSKEWEQVQKSTIEVNTIVIKDKKA